ncbi:MAG: alpha/beta hydrolase family protein [Pyrinomonadaceae bacterium]
MNFAKIKIRQGRPRSAAAITVLMLILASIAAVSGQVSKRIEIENDGWKLFGDLVVPQNAKSVPAVLLLHKADGSRAEYKELAGILASNGIASLRLDLRGHGESKNKGEFGPPYDEKTRSILVGTDSDISAALRYLKKQSGIHPKRIGVLGASYSGEFMALAGRESGYEKAYVELSPGSFSEASIKEIDRSGAAWLFVRSVGEPHLKGLHENIREVSKTAQLYEVPGNEHASRLLSAIPGLKEMIVVWFKHNL